MFRGMIGSLLYLTTSSPDIMQYVYVFARFQANPKESHLTCCEIADYMGKVMLVPNLSCLFSAGTIGADEFKFLPSFNI